jgi:hypothetical protein
MADRIGSPVSLRPFGCANYRKALAPDRVAFAFTTSSEVLPARTTRNAAPPAAGAEDDIMDELIRTFAARGDLAHLALLLWALAASALAWFALRELAAFVRRFEDFVRELARFNERFGGRD